MPIAVCVLKVVIFQFYMEILILVRSFQEALRKIYDSVLIRENADHGDPVF